MRKVNVIMLLIVTLFATSHTTLMFHFCGGEFRSIALAGMVKTCCCGGTEHHETDDCGEAVSNMPCCENHSQEIGTDDFSTDKQEIAFGNGNGNGFHPAALMPFPAFGLGNMSATQAFQHVFPPGGGTVKSGIDLLTFICTFRI